MPIHDGTRVGAGIFPGFHNGWISAIKGAVNRGLLPPEHWALAGQITGRLGPDAVTSALPSHGRPRTCPSSQGPVCLVHPHPIDDLSPARRGDVERVVYHLGVLTVRPHLLM